jgi:hypothetical protein
LQIFRGLERTVAHALCSSNSNGAGRLWKRSTGRLPENIKSRTLALEDAFTPFIRLTQLADFSIVGVSK